MGSSQSDSRQTQQSSTASGSTLAAGGNLSLTGAGQDSRLQVSGSELKAGHDATLKADGDITPQGAQSTSEQHTKPPHPLTPFSNSLNPGVPLVMAASGESRSTTHSGIRGGTIVITDAAKQHSLTGLSVEQSIAGINRDVVGDRDGNQALTKH